MAVFQLNNFDASNYDSSAFNGPTGSGQNLSTLSIKATNNEGGNSNDIQLFNVLRPIWELYDAALSTNVPGIFPNITLTEGTPNTIITATRNYFNQAGSLVMGSDATIEGITVPYATVCKGILAGLNFRVAKLRYAYTSDSQLDQDIVVFRRTIFGKYEENRITPRTYFDPNQQQSKVVDIPITFDVDAEVGLKTTLLASEIVTFNFYVEAQVKPTV